MGLRLQYIHILYPNVARFKKIVYLRELETFKHKIIEGKEFRGGSDEKMRRMWLGREIVVAGLPPLVKMIKIIEKY